MEYRRMVLLIVCLGVLGACGELRMPKREPTQVLGGSDLSAFLSLSTNCVEVGEPLTLTLTLTNTSPDSWVLDGHPPVDIVIEQKERVLVDSWSESRDYPAPFDSVFLPGEVRTYHWTWIARPPFAEMRGIQSGATIRYVTDEFPQGGAFLNLGVHWYTDGEYVVTCDQMR